MIGVFASLDLFLFYIFWEAMLIPMYFIIGIWGGQNRIYAAVKFFLYNIIRQCVDARCDYFAWDISRRLFPADALQQTLLESLIMLLLCFRSTCRCGMFAAFGLSFAIKVPLWPLQYVAARCSRRSTDSWQCNFLPAYYWKMGTYGIYSLQSAALCRSIAACDTVDVHSSCHRNSLLVL